MIYLLLSILAAFGIGYVSMSWYLGTYREYFSSSRAYHVNMFIFLSFILYVGVWARSIL